LEGITILQAKALGQAGLSIVVLLKRNRSVRLSEREEICASARMETQHGAGVKDSGRTDTARTGSTIGACGRKYQKTLPFAATAMLKEGLNFITGIAQWIRMIHYEGPLTFSCRKGTNKSSLSTPI
jgi:hypothetical protein